MSQLIVPLTYTLNYTLSEIAVAYTDKTTDMPNTPNDPCMMDWTIIALANFYTKIV